MTIPAVLYSLSLECLYISVDRQALVKDVDYRIEFGLEKTDIIDAANPLLPRCLMYEIE
jgi:hypothetical protein